MLQLIEGPTLPDKIAQGPIPVEDALKIALQIAEGVEGRTGQINVVLNWFEELKRLVP